MGFDIGFDRRARAFESVQTQKFVGDELVIGRLLQRQEFIEKLTGRFRPWWLVVSSTEAGLEARFILKVCCAQFVEARTAYPQGLGRDRGIKIASVKIMQNAGDQMGWQALGQLFFSLK